MSLRVYSLGTTIKFHFGSLARIFMSCICSIVDQDFCEEFIQNHLIVFKNVYFFFFFPLNLYKQNIKMSYTKKEITDTVLYFYKASGRVGIEIELVLKDRHKNINISYNTKEKRYNVLFLHGQRPGRK